MTLDEAQRELAALADDKTGASNARRGEGHSVNLSKEAEDVAAMFQTRIVPISAGTPQELAFAESGVRNLGKLSRSMMLNAPHLPRWSWGLADKYATYVHDVLPQK